MKIDQVLLMTIVALVASVAVADDKHPYYCSSDDYCEENYSGTACISVHNYGISKCTPNTSKRPACRGAQPGLCPSYQSPERGYLNAHCVFVPASYLGLTSSANSTSGSNEDTDATLSVEVGEDDVAGQFVCVQVSDCESLAADPDTCFPSSCGANSHSDEHCTYQGTCTYTNKTDVSSRRCMCYAGFDGDDCQREVSGACDVDCGTGGVCTDGECVCNQGFDGKAHDGKQGTANERCTRCTNDLACQYNNSCNVDDGKCDCRAGFSGDTCGATEDACTTRTDCGIGDCQLLANGSSACYCPWCSPACTMCDLVGNSTFDCSSCPTNPATTVQISTLVPVIVVSVVTVLLSWTM